MVTTTQRDGMTLAKENMRLADAVFSDFISQLKTLSKKNFTYRTEENENAFHNSWDGGKGQIFNIDYLFVVKEHRGWLDNPRAMVITLHNVYGEGSRDGLSGNSYPSIFTKVNVVIKVENKSLVNMIASITDKLSSKLEEVFHTKASIHLVY